MSIIFRILWFALGFTLVALPYSFYELNREDEMSREGLENFLSETFGQVGMSDSITDLGFLTYEV